MVAGVADTHAALWYLFADPRLSALAKSAFDEAANSRRKIVLSVISLAEVVYLVEKGRAPSSAYTDLQKARSGSCSSGSAGDQRDHRYDASGAARGHPGHARPDCRCDSLVFWCAGYQSRWPHTRFQCANCLVKASGRGAFESENDRAGWHEGR